MSGPDKLAVLGLRGDGIPDSHPDAILLRLIRAAVDLEGRRDEAHANWCARPSRRHGTRQEAEHVYRQTAAAWLEAQEKVVRTHARTVEGARAKLRMVLDEYESDEDDPRPRSGTMMCLPVSAMRDALAMLGG